MWLAFGPLLCHLEYFVGKVSSWTTDCGVEMLSVLFPNVLKAFIAWVDGRPLHLCRPLVDFSERCFPRSLRVAGWSHGFGNVMKKVGKANADWPQRLDQMRAMRRFFFL